MNFMLSWWSSGRFAYLFIADSEGFSRFFFFPYCMHCNHWENKAEIGTFWLWFHGLFSVHRIMRGHQNVYNKRCSHGPVSYYWSEATGAYSRVSWKPFYYISDPFWYLAVQPPWFNLQCLALLLLLLLCLFLWRSCAPVHISILLLSRSSPGIDLDACRSVIPLLWERGLLHGRMLGLVLFCI